MTENTKVKGDWLEQKVERIYKRLGKWNVKRNLTLIDKFGNISQIDVRYGLFFKKYIECKNYSGKPVPLEDVAKFKEVLKLNNIPISRGIFITTSYYVPRASTIGIKTIDGKGLKKLEIKSKYWGIVRTMRNLSFIFIAVAAFPIVKDYKLKDWKKLFELKNLDKERKKIQNWWKQFMKKVRNQLNI